MCIGFQGSRRSSSETSAADAVMRSGAIAYYHTLTKVCQAEYFRHLLKPVT
ncbi:hypothetical protein DAI22_02g142000 [Oryza sativa Japonica Group]|nr:hypothetical protein DAI22_02g142000 [Oryza sativa Japonica Group]